MTELHQGSCLCGEIKFEIEGDFEGLYLCHCKFCQKDTGSAHASNAFSSKAKVRWLTSTQKIQSFHLDNTRHKKSFCLNCGSALPSLHRDGTLLVVPVGSLDSKLEIKPTAHIFYSSRASWDNDLESVKKFETYAD